MRLSERLRRMILSSIHEGFGDVPVYLFGSRVDDSKRGGDIDISVDTNLPKDEFRRRRVRSLSALIRQDLDIKIDIVQYSPSMDELLKREVDAKGVRLDR